MSAELITYGADRRCVLGAAEAIRSPIYTNTWTKIRIGLQLSFDAVAASISGNPLIAFGVCNGSSNVLITPTSDHVIGFRSMSNLTHNAGPPAYFTGASTPDFFKRVGSTVTTVSNAGTMFYSNATSIRSGLFLEITKGSPNYSFAWGSPNTAGATQSDLTDTEFLAMMQLATFNTAGISGIKANYTVYSTSVLAVNEGTDGALDHIFVYWERTSHKFTFNLRHRMVS